MQLLFADATDDTAASAVAAIGCASIRDQKKHAIGIPMDETRNGHVRIFAARIGHLERGPVGLFDARDDLATDWTVRIFRVNEIEKMRCNRERKLVSGQNYAGALFPRKRDLLFELLQIGDPVFELPFPVVPEFGSDIWPKAGSERKEPLIGGFS
jgi:hypothetical protein